MKARTYNILIGLVAVAIVGVLAWPYIRARPVVSADAPPTAAMMLADPPITARGHEDPLGLTIQPDGLSIENRTDGALEQCVVQILGGWAALVPIVPARATEFRFFTALIDSTDREAEAHMAGHTWKEFVLANAKAKTSVACRDINGNRVAMVFQP